MFPYFFVFLQSIMKTLHIFNPEHEIALAANLAHFTPPHAGRQLKADLGWLPALWADADDYVLVDHSEAARKCYERLRRRLGRPICQFVDRSDLPHLDVQQVKPWGWDSALVTDLHRWGLSVNLLPESSRLECWRQLAHRRTSARLLSSLRLEGTVGEAVECSDVEQVEAFMSRWQRVVVKAPWSSSGRGVRFYDTERLVDQGKLMVDNWIRNVIKQQGSVMVEPYYNKVKDFGMEFERDANGQVHYLGLSLFHTKNGAYIGNLLATEETKRAQMARYLSLDLLDSVRQRIIDNILLADYQGPFGIDMMIVNSPCNATLSKREFSNLNSHLLLHPCVELNLRRTMGHVALSLMPTDDDIRKVMHIELTDHYKLHIRKAQ